MLQTVSCSGLTVLVDQLPHTHSVSIGCFVMAGAAHEERDTAGISHFIEHLLFKGSRAYPTPKALSDAIEGVGGILDAYTGFDTTVYYAKVADIHVNRAVTVLADMLLHPRLDRRDIEKERRVITEEIRQTVDTPSDLVHLLSDSAMWGDQPLGRDIAGDEQSVATIGAGAIRDWWRSRYVRGAVIISIAGNITVEQATSLIEQAFAQLPAGDAAPFPASRSPLPGPQLTFKHDNSEQSNFCLGFPGVAQNDPDRRALLVFDSVIGGSMSSRLFQEIREERGLAYSIGSYSREHHDAGKWQVYGSVEPSKLEECIATIMLELRRARAEGITAAELAQVKEQVKGGILLSLEDTWSVASRNGSHMARYGRVVPLEQVVAEVEAVTVDDVLRVAQRVLREDLLHLAVIGPHADEARLVGLLRL